jgi:hypothetical protein
MFFGGKTMLPDLQPDAAEYEFFNENRYHGPRIQALVWCGMQEAQSGLILSANNFLQNRRDCRINKSAVLFVSRQHRLVFRPDSSMQISLFPNGNSLHLKRCFRTDTD